MMKRVLVSSVIIFVSLIMTAQTGLTYYLP